MKTFLGNILINIKQGWKNDIRKCIERFTKNIDRNEKDYKMRKNTKNGLSLIDT